MVPAGAVLVGQAHDGTGVVAAGVAAGVLEHHQREQGVDDRPASPTTSRTSSAEPDRLPGQRDAHDVGPGARRVPGGEGEVDDLGDGVEPAGQRRLRGHREGHAGGHDLALGPRETGRHRRLGDEEQPGDVRRRQTEDQPQRQGAGRIPGRGRDGRRAGRAAAARRRSGRPGRRRPRGPTGRSRRRRRAGAPCGRPPPRTAAGRRCAAGPPSSATPGGWPAPSPRPSGRRQRTRRRARPPRGRGGGSGRRAWPAAGPTRRARSARGRPCRLLDGVGERAVGHRPATTYVTNAPTTCRRWPARAPRWRSRRR